MTTDRRLRFVNLKSRVHSTGLMLFVEYHSCFEFLMIEYLGNSWDAVLWTTNHYLHHYHHQRIDIYTHTHTHIPPRRRTLGNVTKSETDYTHFSGSRRAEWAAGLSSGSPFGSLELNQWNFVPLAIYSPSCTYHNVQMSLVFVVAMATCRNNAVSPATDLSSRGARGAGRPPGHSFPQDQ